MDGPALLFGPFVRALPDGVEPGAVAYPLLAEELLARLAPGARAAASGGCYGDAS